MKWEMSDKFRHLSQVLVGELQTRDQLIHSLNVKNTFISSLLKVESIRYHPTEERPASAKVYRWWKMHVIRRLPLSQLFVYFPLHAVPTVSDSLPSARQR